jgi:hypothetical protein
MENTTVSYKYLKLITGDELVAAVHVSEDNSSTMVLEKPLRLIFIPDHSTGSLASFYVSLGPWIPCTTDTHFTIKKDSVMVMSSVSSEMIHQYTSSTKNIGGKIVSPEESKEMIDREMHEADERIVNLLDGLSQLEALSELEDYDTSTGTSSLPPGKKGKKLLN